ncbi:gliding motility-associated ABC transporter substrate-binding protein GldG [Rhodocytophaga rosea]|uniref:Gliding motility-associated ABC transporter substrate-binding protein GldG n=1 Tax=Rhodocytophaga rosea TaxID=2704465 RepID=A0A6C0GMU4_9BACT|nr:gliding motility-associated ABC transporter substrate-binding protein GldG [Rhodocytophaga rosea]QHT69356.1 gliding motility-associated ABC transporter substrate-binding protein GldG [Rhodocytophaga rosea]
MKKKQLLQFGIGIGIIILLNIAATQLFFRIDLTEDKRYSISPATEQILENLDDQVFVTVYLAGDDLPAGFKRLETAIRERLEEFTVYGGKNIQYTFTDPGAIVDKKARSKFYQQLISKGIQPTNLFAKEGDRQIEKLIFPGALVSYQGKELPVLLLKGNKATGSEQILNQSVENVEFELASAMRKLSVTDKKRIGFLLGHGEPQGTEIADLVNSLQEYHEVYPVDLPKSPNLQGLDLIIVAKPDTFFSEEDKYKIDQFIVNGGKALFFVDALRLDSLTEKGAYAFPYNLNLDDLFFRYGVRLNGNLIQDLMSASIPLNIGNMGDQPQIKPMPWPYYPLLNTFSKHPVVRNMDVVYTRYVGTMDTVKATGIVKTPLMLTSQYTRLVPAPAHVSFNQAALDLNPALYQKGSFPTAYLLEGKFRSLFANRITSADPRSTTFKETGNASKVIVCSDGDLPTNEINPKTGKFLPLGYDRFSQNTFANKDFALNAIDYLLDENGVITARNKEIALRPLDKLRIREERLQWQVINLVAPVLLIVLFGIARAYGRKRKYAVAVNS